MGRWDTIGLLWQDATRINRKGNKTQFLGPVPETPETGWRPPTDYPNLFGVKLLGFDTETKDPDLRLRGPGWARHQGHVVGFSFSTEDGHKWYFPLRHEVEPEYNMPDMEGCLRWAKAILEQPTLGLVGANLIYDAGWMREENIRIAGKLWDVQNAEALLTEDSRTALDILGAKYCGRGKESDQMYRWIDLAYGRQRDPRSEIYRTSPRLVGPYAESDAELPFAILRKQWQQLDAEGLLPLYDIETRITPMLIDMRMQGVHVDLERATQIRARLVYERDTIMNQIEALAGREINLMSSADLALLFDKQNIRYPRTAKGNPSFTKNFLEHLDHPIGQMIRDWRERDKLIGTFIDSYILDSHIDGKIYCQFHQLRGDAGGTRTGRFSSSTPNLQNISVRTALGRLIREIFIPQQGHACWRRYDWNQIEYRFLAHFALGSGSDFVRERYIHDPKTDYHALLQETIQNLAQIKLDRKAVKTINFGLVYGMGMRKLLASIGSGGEAIFEHYHKALPFVKETQQYYSQQAQMIGYTQTILGRRRRFQLWENAVWGEDSGIALPYDTAIRRYPKVRRAYTHKALNSVLQGSAADLAKMAMLSCYESGIFAQTGLPTIIVHDEYNFSCPDAAYAAEAFALMKTTMEQSLPISVPVILDGEAGSNWGNCKAV